MLDLSHIPNSQRDTQIFYAISSNTWQTWNKPRNCQWVWIMCVGSGAGGAGGLTNAVYGGSSGGGSGAVTRAMFNAYHLPDTLYVQVGLGGEGGLPDNNGNTGNRSWVSITPSIVSINSVLSSGVTVANFGFTSGAIAAGEGPFTNAVSHFANLSIFQSISGATSIVASLVPTQVTPLSSRITCQGAQGAGQDSSLLTAIDGASILATNISPLISGGIGFGMTEGSGGNGCDGYTSWSPFFSTGGAGGGNGITGGGMGGAGGIGSGGGAGGQGGVLGGTGGRGGDGLVIIVAF